jgi:hypothetical protein
VLATSAAAISTAVPIGTLLGGPSLEWLGLSGAIALLATGNVVRCLAAVALLARGRISLEPAAGVR